MNDHRDFRGEREEIERPDPDGCSLKTRIFVGGLGASVTPKDLEATFSSLGRAHGVEIIRSNDRNFGYMDFEPFSDKALSKLFSSYNGCMWKGGRLRLEKAKEHYLVRLHQEWTEEAAQSATITAEVGASTTSNTPDKRTQILSDKSGLKMFFPRLKKIKVLPSRGTGKHKYSFQRVESLPLHQLQVCGCKEHSMHRESDESNQYVLDAGDDAIYNGGICEKELNVMNRVMQRLLGNEDQIQTETEQSEKTQPVHVYKYAKRGPGKARIDMERFNDSDDTEGSNYSEAAAENLDELVMAKNIAQDLVKGSDNLETISLESDQVVEELKDGVNLSRGITHESTSVKAKFCNAKSGENDFRTEVQRKITPKNKNLLPLEGDADYQPEVQKPKARKRVRFGDTVCGLIQHEEARGDSNIDNGVELKSNTDFKVQDRGRISQLQDDTCSWTQKASWKDLVGVTGRSSFSLSSIIGGVSSSPLAVKSKESESHGAANKNSLEDVTKENRKKPAKFCNVKSGENDFRTEVQRKITPKNKNFLPLEGDTEYQPEVQKSEVGKRVRVGDTVCGLIQHEEARNDSIIGDGVEMKSNSDFKVQDSGRVSQLQDDTRSWIQKASWKDLVGVAGQASFTLSSITGGVSSSPFAVKSKESGIHGAANNNSQEDVTKEVNRKMPKGNGKDGTQEGLQGSNDEASQSFGGQPIKPPCSESEDKSEPVGEMKAMSDAVKEQGPEENKTQMQRQNKKGKVDKDLQLYTQDTVSSATCTFMRSDDAEDEWLKSKAVVQGYAKARRKMALKSIKMLGVDPAGRR